MPRFGMREHEKVMGYTHYWYQKRPFTPAEWQTIVAEAKRIVAKAKRGEYYQGRETFKTAQEADTSTGFRAGFAEPAWRTFPHEEIPTPQQGAVITVCGPVGTGKPVFYNDEIALNGSAAKTEDYETFALERSPVAPKWAKPEEVKAKGIFSFCKTEYRPYDAVVVSILHVAQFVAPDAIEVKSDGGTEAIRLLF